jgi:hypothetical protein
MLELCASGNVDVVPGTFVPYSDETALDGGWVHVERALWDPLLDAALIQTFIRHEDGLNAKEAPDFGDLFETSFQRWARRLPGQQSAHELQCLCDFTIAAKWDCCRAWAFDAPWPTALMSLSRFALETDDWGGFAFNVLNMGRGLIAERLHRTFEVFYSVLEHYKADHARHRCARCSRD